MMGAPRGITAILCLPAAVPKRPTVRWRCVWDTPRLASSAWKAPAPSLQRRSCETVIWYTRFDFAVPPDVAWEEVKAALAPMGGVVTSEDFRTLLIEHRSPVDVVEFKLAMRPGATDETSVLVVDEASVLVGDPRGWQVLESFSYELIHIIKGLHYLRNPLVFRLRDEEFRHALKGYNVEEVDEFLEALAARLERGEALFPEDVMSNGFRISWKGYHKQDVDSFLELLAAAINTQSH